MGEIGLRDVTIAFGGRTVLEGVDLDVGQGEVVAVLGGSGSGKTSLLRVVAGFDAPRRGRVLIAGADVTELPTRERDLGMVAQGATLQPTTDVEGNVAFPLEIRGDTPAETRRRVTAETRAFGLARLLRRRPNELSTGERHATATARSVVRAPSALLLDEPVTHLDPRTRASVLAQVRTVQQGYGTTMLLATNDLAVALALADRIAVIGGRTLAQVGTHEELLAAPVTLDVADLVSPAPLSRLLGRVGVPRPGERTRVRTAAGELATWSPLLREHRGPVVVGVGPGDATLTRPGRGALRGRVRRVVTTGARRLVTVATDAGLLSVRTPPTAPVVGTDVGVDVQRAVVAEEHGDVLAVLTWP